LFQATDNTPAQLSEDIEWLKIIEMGYKIKSYEVDSYEIGINTIDDYNYLSKKYTNSLATD
jgi:CMP-2-keto-3-deoxyoctulosonic acid synthetase